MDTLDFNGNGSRAEILIAASTPTGIGDILCPDTNRSINGGQPVDDSRRFAPLQLGDHVTVRGNLETINCQYFLSAHSLQVSKKLFTKNLANQPDYMIITQALIEAPGFQDQKIESFFSGATTQAPADVVIWSVHNDPISNGLHEFLLATTLGCDAAAGVGACTAKGVLPATGGDIFSISHIVDFRFLPTARLLDPCAHLRADTRFIPLNVCPAGGTFAEQFGILSPLPRQIHARTGHKLVNPGLVTLDVRGNSAPNGQYYSQLGIGLTSIMLPNFLGIDMDLIKTPISFSGIPWNLDRRLSPGGCLPSGCDATPQPLDPFPFEVIDPRIQATTPTGPYVDPNFNRGVLSVANNRVLSYVSGIPFSGVYNFNGNSTVLAWPPIDPAPRPISVAPPVTPRPPVVTITSSPVLTAVQGQPYSYQAAATTRGLCGGITYSLDQAPAGMTVNGAGLVQWTPTAAQGGANLVTLRATEPSGAFDTQSFAILTDAPGPTAVNINDFDKDGLTDMAVWRAANGVWYIVRSSDGATIETQWGTGTQFAKSDVPVPGDYDGDGKTDLAVWRPSDGTWYVIRSTNGTVTTTQWGTGTVFSSPDAPVPGDYDGDGKTDLAVWRPSDGTWYVIRSSDGAVTTTQWGTGTVFANPDVPVPADYDGDGKTDIAVWRPSDGTWYVMRSSDGTVTTTQWGTGTVFANPDVPVPGDYDGDGKTDIAVWRPSDGTWYVIRSSDGAATTTQWGAPTDIPVPGDYDGDGKTDIAVWRPGTGDWLIHSSKLRISYVIHWGGDPSDVPIGRLIR